MSTQGQAQAAASDDYTVVIGLEVHVQLETDTKIFCGCATDPEAEPNTNVCPVCLGLPGALPVLNEAAVTAAIKVTKALNGSIPETTRFHRKNYYYPDLPKNFQITQYEDPICQGGHVEVEHEGDRRTIGIRRAHLEEDPGSLRHVGGSIDTADYTLIDYNRAGTPLLEIVTEPDFRAPGEVRAFLTKLTEMLEYLDVFDTSRDGSLRVDANISLVEETAVDTNGEIDTAALADANRTEVKNISSHKGAERALAYEVTRQKNALRRGRAVDQETRHWDESKGITVGMRSKEAEKDYRYFEEPDIPPLSIADWTEEITIPELPEQRRHRFVEEYGLTPDDAEKLTVTRSVADFYEAVAADFDPAFAASWIADTLLGELHYRDLTMTDIDDRFDEIRRLLRLIDEEAITEKNAHEVVLRTMLDAGTDPETIVEQEGLGKSDDDAIATAVEEVITENPDAVSDYHAGEDGAINYLVGQVMQATGGSADPGTVNELLRDRLADTT